jgi:hypothetical protein
MSSIWCSWDTFTTAAPVLAADIQYLLEPYGRGQAYLATVRPDGGPRIHPVAPVITEGGLYCFIIRSPKRRDLDRDGRYALHSFPDGRRSDEAYLAGRARAVTDPERRDRVAFEFQPTITVDWGLYELGIDVVMLTHRGADLLEADHQIWHANGPRFNLFRL